MEIAKKYAELKSTAKGKKALEEAVTAGILIERYQRAKESKDAKAAAKACKAAKEIDLDLIDLANS